MNLIILFKNFYVGYAVDLIFLVSVLSIFFGIIIIVAKNPIHSILFLIGLFCTISLYLILTGLVFIALSYLLVYVGAISILFLFIVMLINIRVSELITEGKNSLILAILTLIAFNYSVNNVMPQNILIDNYNDNVIFNLFDKFTALYESITILAVKFGTYFVGNVNSKLWEIVLVQISHISAVGNILYTNLLIYLVLISLILLLAMVGVIIIIKS